MLHFLSRSASHSSFPIKKIYFAILIEGHRFEAACNDPIPATKKKTEVITFGFCFMYTYEMIDSRVLSACTPSKNVSYCKSRNWRNEAKASLSMVEFSYEPMSRAFLEVSKANMSVSTICSSNRCTAKWAKCTFK